MSFLACILPVLTFLCQPVLGAVETCVGGQAQRFLAFLTNWADGLFVDRGSPADEVAERGCPAEEVPESVSEIVGVEETLSEIRSHLINDESVGIIGICGMGGVGKTTMLKRINNEFLEPGRWGSFDLVIWVTVSQTVSILNIQRQIAERLSISLSGSSSEVENARVLFKALSNKRFLVLLDDLWEPLDHLEDIGIPAHRRGTNSKIVLTARSLQVCSGMDAKAIPVKRLDGASSWKLFSSKLGTKEVVRNNPTIRLLAEQVVQKCGGLPLALITVGRAMANRELIQDWEYAVNALDRYAERLQGMDKVLSCLKFSYDYLKNDNMRSVLLFCAMYEEDEEISTAKLVDYLVGEGLVDDENDGGEGSMNDARGAGQALINKLLDTCLLESGTVSWTVKMHDAVRDMALWINRHEYNKVDGFLACHSIIRREDREHIKRIRLRDKDLEEDARFNPDVILSCSSNRTLVLKDVRGLRPPILQGIASSMKSTLRVLDLWNSDTWWELPAEVGLMAELRFLGLSSTGITSLPKELGNLAKLRQLFINTNILEQIPQEAIAGLRSLQVLDMSCTVYDWEADPRGGEDGGRQLELGDLEASLPRLEELGIQLGTPRALERFLKSDKLCSRTRELRVKMRHRSQSEDPPLYGEGGYLLRRVFSRMGRSLKTLELHGDDAHPWEGGLRISLDQLPLEHLSLSNFRSERMPEVVLVGSNFNPRSSSNIVRLTTFIMIWCDGQKVLKLVGAFPCLQNIHLSHCSTMEELALDEGVAAGIAEEGTQDDAGLLDRHFPMLSGIFLSELPALKSIGRRPLRLPELRLISLLHCPELRRIPVDPAGVPKLGTIFARQEWWDTVECAGSGGHDTKPVFEKKFRGLGVEEVGGTAKPQLAEARHGELDRGGVRVGRQHSNSLASEAAEVVAR
ncbi:hypothetical protein Taro_042483 [Colocasia esculenta]|uniref:Uncharacterized protein n=1 Tax=Colocasia esculenta TaxID=4460 RepID=A0A843WWM4_COLES|nr:hypothetical protein [Colocasia esculenta]